jgi:O-antigen/teichoic acid export membrane protein
MSTDHGLLHKRETSFRSDVLRLASGTAVAQLIAILASPIITRMYAPESFGVVAMFTSIVTILSIAACLRYELAIALPESDEEAANLLIGCVFISLFVAFLSAVFINIGGSYLLYWMKQPELEMFLWLIPVAVFFSGTSQAFNYWATRRKLFTQQSAAKIINVISGTVTKISSGYIGCATTSVMIIADLLGQFLYMLAIGSFVIYDNGRFLLRSFQWSKLVLGLKKNKKFPLYSIWSGFLNTMSWQLPVILLGAFFSSTIVGFYSLGFRILQLPMNLLGQAVGQAFYQRAAEANIKGKMAPLIKNLFQCLFVICFFPMLLLALTGKDLFVIFFGEDWAMAGVYAQILSIWGIAWFISSPLSRIFGVSGKNEQGLIVQVFIFVSRIISVGIGVYFNSPVLVMFLFSFTGFFVYANLIIKIFKISGVKCREAFLEPEMVHCVLLSSFLLILIVVMKQAIDNLIVLISFSFICLLIYFTLCLKMRILNIPR